MSRKEVYEHTEECPNCDSKWYLKYKDADTGESPTFCPFCGECLEDWEAEDDLWIDEDDEDI